jgi:hypothetical protein
VGWLLLGAVAPIACEAPPSEVPDRATRAINGGSLVTQNTPPADSVVKIEGCTGTKIGTRRFLTAAHCFPNLSAGTTIRITNRLDGAFVAGTTFTISKIDRHPSFDARVQEGAGLQFSRVFEATIIEINADTPAIPTLPIRAAFVEDGPGALVFGFGCDPKTPGNSGQKQVATMFSTFNSDQDIYDHFWTSRPDSTAMICNGDSGGPTLTQNPNAGFRWEVSGINVGIGPGAQSGFSRTGSVLRWINAPAKNVFQNGEVGSFLNGASTYCMGVVGASNSPGAQVSQFFCDGRNQPNDDESWRLTQGFSGTFRISNGKSGLCLGVEGASLAEGALVKQQTCDNNADPSGTQAWRFIGRSGTSFNLFVNGRSNKCLTVATSDGSGNGTNLIQSACPAQAGPNRGSWLFTR